MERRTIFITFTRGLLVRNVLRNQFFNLLQATPGLRIVLLFSKYSDRDGEYLRSEFEGKNIIVEMVPNVRESRIKRVFTELARNLVFSPTTRLYARHGTSKVAKKGVLTNILLNAVYIPLSRVGLLKKLVRLIETYVFRDDQYGSYFDRYMPDLVFSTAILSNFDLAFLKHARRRGIPTVGMPKSWDNLDKILFRFEPDAFFVQNEHMRGDALRYQGFGESTTIPVGFLQFDIYRDPAAIESRESYCARHGFESALPIVMAGSEGLWSPGDDAIFKHVLELRDSGELPDFNMIIRPHFSEPYDGRYDRLRSHARVFIDNTYRVTEFFADHWDPTLEDMRDFANTLRHCDISINFASTLSLDATCFDKPIINVAFGIRFENGRDVTPIIYETGFYREVIGTGATELVYDYAELVRSIKDGLAHPERRHEGREKLRKKLCYNLDGQSGVRLYREVINRLDHGRAAR